MRRGKVGAEHEMGRLRRLGFSGRAITGLDENTYGPHRLKNVYPHACHGKQPKEGKRRPTQTQKYQDGNKNTCKSTKELLHKGSANRPDSPLWLRKSATTDQEQQQGAYKNRKKPARLCPATMGAIKRRVREKDPKRKKHGVGQEGGGGKASW